MKSLLNKIKIYWKLIIFFLSLFIFYFIVLNYFQNNLNYFDLKIYNLISKYQSAGLTTIMKIITTLCHIIIVGYLIIILLVLSKNKLYGIYMGLNVFFVWLLNTIVKNIVKRPRPDGINLITEKGFSFPSGHAMVSVAVYGFLLYIIYHLNLSKKLRIFLCSQLLIVIILIGISRIYLGVHYASDVIAGFALGSAYIVVFLKYFSENSNNLK